MEGEEKEEENRGEDGGDEDNGEDENEATGGRMQRNGTNDRDEDVANDAVDGVEITPIGGDGSSGVLSSRMPSPSIQALLVIDRRIDLVTPMLTPLTYEGLIDDVLQIQVGGCVSVKKAIVEPDDDEKGNEQQWQKHQQPQRQRLRQLQKQQQRQQKHQPQQQTQKQTAPVVSEGSVQRQS